MLPVIFILCTVESYGCHRGVVVHMKTIGMSGHSNLKTVKYV